MGHSCWFNVYNEPELPGWLFAQKRSADTPPTPGGKPGRGGSGGGGSPRGEADAYWSRLADAIRRAKDGDVVKANPGKFDEMPRSVLDALRGRDVTLVVSGNFAGGPIVIYGGDVLPREKGRVFYPLSDLAELYAETAAKACRKRPRKAV